VAVRSFDDFWPIFLSYHSDRASKNARLMAGIAGAALVAAGATRRDARALAAAPVVAAVGPALAHLRSASHRELLWLHPRWALRAEARLIRLSVTGRLDDELARYGIFSDAEIIDVTR
jgi:hypothetical protein